MNGTDGELVLAVRAGDAAAVAELFARYWKKARAAAYGVTGDPGAADDAASAGFQAAFSGLDSLTDPQRFAPWLRRIVVRTARRTRGRELAPQDLVDAESLEEDLVRRELVHGVRRGVDRLSPPLREAIALHYFEAYPIDEVARFLDVPEGTVKRRLHDGRKKLAEALNKTSPAMKIPTDEELDRALRDPGDAWRLIQTTLRKGLIAPELVTRLQNAVARKMAASPMSADVQRLLSHSSRHFAGWSSSATDPSSPVSTIAASALAVTSSFAEWRVEPVPVNFANGSVALPPPLAEGRPGIFRRRTRLLLAKDQDGHILPMRDVAVRADSMQEFKTTLAEGRLCNSLHLIWLTGEHVPLADVEETARAILHEGFPALTVSFAIEKLRMVYRAAFRIDAAGRCVGMGGVRASMRPGLADVAQLHLYLEPLTMALTGADVPMPTLKEETGRMMAELKASDGR